MSLRDAIARFVPDGSSIVMGTALEAAIPFAAGHEIIRQGRRDLTLIGPISDILFDELIGAGCASRVAAAWVGNVSAGLAHNLRRAVEQGIPRRIAVQDYSNLTLSLALQAAALGSPFIPTQSLLGSDIPSTNPGLRVISSPLNGERLLLVTALKPDLAIIHVQRSDEGGNAQAWGNLGVTEEAALAAGRILIVAEEIVPRQVILSDPNRVLAPSFRVAAVVHEPGGAHPSPVQGYYNRDHRYFEDYHQASRTRAGFEQWLQDWVTGVRDRGEYLQRLGEERWRALQAREHRYAEPVDYGY
ncbi:MAG: CoA transferase subunit A [Rudaea sp.]